MKPSEKEALLKEQRHERTAYEIYSRLSKHTKNLDNAAILNQIAQDEKRHAEELALITGQQLKPSMLQVYYFTAISKILGLTFGLKLLEGTENKAQDAYDPLKEVNVVIEGIMTDEDRHEKDLINMIEEERLKYIGSIVLGLNDALVELTGALAGYTLAFQNSQLIAVTGLITGISAAFSMASSEYLSTKHEGGEAPLQSAVYTGLTYLGTVVILILPFLLISSPIIALLLTLSAAVIVIAAFNFYISVAKDLSFKKRFVEMAGISLGVSGISFIIGYLVNQFLGISI